MLSGSAAKTITVTYKAKLNDKAKTGFDANTNEVRLKYSNSPSTEDDSKKDKTYHYTFDIDGNVGGTKVNLSTMKLIVRGGWSLKNCILILS